MIAADIIQHQDASSALGVLDRLGHPVRAYLGMRDGDPWAVNRKAGMPADPHIGSRIDSWLQRNRGVLEGGSPMQLKAASERLSSLLEHPEVRGHRRCSKTVSDMILRVNSYFQSAVERGDLETIPALMGLPRSPLNQAIFEGDYNKIEYLLQSGDNPNIVAGSKTSLDVAHDALLFNTHDTLTREQALRVTRLLRSYGAHPAEETVPRSGKTHSNLMRSFQVVNSEYDVPLENDSYEDYLDPADRDVVIEIGALPESPPPPDGGLEPVVDPVPVVRMDENAPSCGRQAVSYFTDPFKCTKAQCLKNVKFCCNRAWCTCTPKRAFGLLSGAAIYGSAGYLFWRFGPLAFGNLVDSVAGFVVINGYETALSMIAVFQSTPSLIPPTPAHRLAQLAVVIPVHGADKDIEATLLSIKAVGIGYHQIIVMENTGGRYAALSRDESRTYRLLTRDPRFAAVNYRWANFGAKVAAEYLGAVAAKELGFTDMMAIDDDVILPEDFDPGLLLLDGKVKMIVYPITPSNAKANYVTDNQGTEYAAADRANRFKEKADAVLAPHGAINTSDLDFYLETMRYPPVDGAFNAEDQKKGAAWRWRGAYLAMMGGPPVGTEVPDNLATFWSQRVGSWDIGGTIICGISTEDLLTDWMRTCEISEILKLTIRKLFQFQTVFANVADVARPILLVSSASSWWFWAVLGILWEAKNLTMIAGETFFDPHHRGMTVCEPRLLAKSCMVQHTSCVYNAMQLMHGSIAACCGWIGAGAADPEDFAIKKPYMSELRTILDIKDNTVRYMQLRRYLQDISPTVPRPGITIDRIYMRDDL